MIHGAALAAFKGSRCQSVLNIGIWIGSMLDERAVSTFRELRLLYWMIIIGICSIYLWWFDSYYLLWIRSLLLSAQAWCGPAFDRVMRALRLVPLIYFAKSKYHVVDSFLLIGHFSFLNVELRYTEMACVRFQKFYAILREFCFFVRFKFGESIILFVSISNLSRIRPRLWSSSNC